MRITIRPTCRQLLALAAALLLATLMAAASPAVAGLALIDHLVDEFTVVDYTATHQTIEDMGLGLYNPAYNQGNRGRNANTSGGTDSLGNQECRQYLVDQFTSLGLLTSTQGIYDNVVGEITGTTRPQDVYIIGAHYDTTADSRPGGDDNGSGTAAVVELARILSQYQFEATIRLIGFNTEEDGLKGSNDYVSKVVVAGGQHVVGMISLDMILRPQNDRNLGLPVDLDLGCPPSADDLAWVNLFKADAADYVPELAIDATTPFTANWGSSDHQPFANAGYAAFIAIENSVDEIRANSNGYYHQSGDWSGGAAGAAYDYDFATLVTQAVAATLAVEAEIIAAPLVLYAGAATDFVYQNTPLTTAGRQRLTLHLTVGPDLNGNATFTTLVTKLSGPGDVEIVETDDPLVWEIVGSQIGEGAIGEVTLRAQVGGNEFGGEGETTFPVTVRTLGDIDGLNGVNGQDKLLINKRLNGLLPDGPQYDLDGLGGSNGLDKLILNKILNGLEIP